MANVPIPIRQATRKPRPRLVPGWEVPLAQFFDRRNWHAPPAMYAYDFGDDWPNVLVHEGLTETLTPHERASCGNRA